MIKDPSSLVRPGTHSNEMETGHNPALTVCRADQPWFRSCKRRVVLLSRSTT